MASMSTYGTFFSNGTIVGEISSISFGGVSATAIDVSILSSTASQYAAGYADGGTVTITMMVFPATQQQIQANDTVGAGSYAIKLGGAVVGKPSIGFNAYIQGLTFEAQPDGVLMATLTLRIDGVVSITTQLT